MQEMMAFVTDPYGFDGCLSVHFHISAAAFYKPSDGSPGLRRYYCPFACRADQGDTRNLKSRCALEKHILQSHMAAFREFSKGTMKILYVEPQVFMCRGHKQPRVVLAPLMSGTASVVDLAKQARSTAPRFVLPPTSSDDRSAASMLLVAC